VALSQARILYQNHSGDYPQVILTIPVTCRTAGIYRNVGPLLLNLLYDTDKSLVNAGMTEKVSSASAFLPAVNFVSPTSVFGIRVSPVPLVTD
jgi:hypothetical protein